MSVSADLLLRCACGAVRGRVLEASPETVNRATCYCDDCQAFAKFLGREDIVTPRGGTDIVQVAPSRIDFTEGFDKLRAIRLKPDGMHRCYTDCCRSPAGNMMNTPRTPFVGFPTRFLAAEGPGGMQAVAGVESPGMLGKYAIGGCPPGVSESAPPAFLARAGAWLLGNVLAGRHRPSPYWDRHTGRATVEARVLSRGEREALRPTP